jgi:hypothetical protein
MNKKMTAAYLLTCLAAAISHDVGNTFTTVACVVVAFLIGRFYD